MFRLSRYRGVALVAASVVIAVGLLDLSLTAAVGFTGRFLPDHEEPNDDSVLKDTGGRISGVLSLPRRPGIGTGIPLGVMLGTSTTRAGVDFEVLEENDGLPLRWLNLCGWGGSINRIRGIAELLFVSGLRPDVVVIGVNPHMLIGNDIETVRREAVGRTGAFIKPWIWVFDNYLMVNHLFRLACHRVRLGLFQGFGFSFPAVYPAKPDPWELERYERRPAFSADEEARELESYRRLGWFDPDRYYPESLNGHALVEIVRASREMGANVCIILVPEPSLLRANTPPRAIRCFEEINRANFPGDPVLVYDLRDRIPDDLFYDLIHPNFDARRPISVLVADCVHDFLSGHPAPERFQSRVGGASTGVAESKPTP